MSNVKIPKDIRALKFEEEPPYLELRKMFWKVALREKIEYDGQFDWVKLKEE